MAKPDDRDEPEAAPAAPDEAPARAPKKKKRRPKEGVMSSGEPEDTSDAARAEAPDEGRPAFAVGYPKHPELERLVRLFEEGNYADVNDGVLMLERNGAPDEVLRAARDLSRRTKPEPASLVLLVLAMLLLAILAGWYMSHRHAEPAPGPPVPSGAKPLPVYSR